MAVALTGSTGATDAVGSATTLVVTRTTAAGALLILHVSWNVGDTTTISITDSASQTWTKASKGDKAGSNGTRSEIWYKINSAAITSLTITQSAASVKSAVLQEFSGFGAGTLKTGDTNTTGGTATPALTNTIAPNAGDLVVANMNLANTAAITVVTTGSWVADVNPQGTLSGNRCVPAYKLSGTTSESESWTFAAGTKNWGATIAAFTPAAAAGIPNVEQAVVKAKPSRELARIFLLLPQTVPPPDPWWPAPTRIAPTVHVVPPRLSQSILDLISPVTVPPNPPPVILIAANPHVVPPRLSKVYLELLTQTVPPPDPWWPAPVFRNATAPFVPPQPSRLYLLLPQTVPAPDPWWPAPTFQVVTPPGKSQELARLLLILPQAAPPNPPPVILQTPFGTPYVPPRLSKVVLELLTQTPAPDPWWPAPVFRSATTPTKPGAQQVAFDLLTAMAPPAVVLTVVTRPNRPGQQVVILDLNTYAPAAPILPLVVQAIRAFLPARLNALPGLVWFPPPPAQQAPDGTVPDDPWFRRLRREPDIAPVEAQSLYISLVGRYGLEEGQAIYASMMAEGKGPFKPGGKYDPARRGQGH